MSTQTMFQQIRWEDLKIRSELDIVFEIAQKKGWGDCEIFGHGDMITQPQASMGWKLIPADLYKYSIPTEAVARLHQIINAGIRVRGVIIADDERKIEQPPAAPAAPKPGLGLPSVKPILSWIGKALLGSIASVRAVVRSFSKAVLSGLIGTLRAVLSLFGAVLLGLFRVVGVIVPIALFIYAFIHFGPVVLLPAIFIGLGLSTGTDTKYDPKMVVLVDDGAGGTVWVSLFTWYD